MRIENIREGTYAIRDSKILIEVAIVDEDICINVKNSSATPQFIQELELGELPASERLFINNFQSWGPTDFANSDKNFVFNRNGFMFSPLPRELRGFISDYFIATDKEFAGFLDSRVAHPYFLCEDGKVHVKAYVGRELEAGEEVELGTLWLTEYDSLEETLEKYAKRVATFNNPRIGRAFFGWSSWYHYLLDITERDFLEELRLSKEKKIDYELFQLDDGYESDIGDWLKTNEKFSKGLEYIAKSVKKSGMIPGIWLAPFSVSESSELFKAHPDWVVKDKDGRPVLAYENWKRKIYALDTSNPEALKWLKNVFRTLKNFGFDLFKIDFLFAGMIPGRRYANVTPVEAYRMGMKAIRESVGDSHVLGCGASLLPSIGLVDSMRIGEDTAPYWESNGEGGPGEKGSVRNALTRNFMNGVWWTNDPDCVLTRSEDTNLNKFERETNVFVRALLNGHFLQSDKLSRIDKKERALLSSALNFRGGKANVKFFSSERYIVNAKDTHNGDVLTFVNLSDFEWKVKKEFLRSGSDVFFVSYPSMKEIKSFEEVKVPPHGVFMVMIRRKVNLKRTDEEKDGREFHYYESDAL